MPERFSSTSTSLAGTWPLVGRDRELESIALAREDAGCTGVVVSAGAGIGKSRLAREAHAAAERDGALVDWVQATSSAAGVPLGAFAGLLPDGIRSGDTLALMRRSADALRERAAGRTVVLGVDDAQLLDPVSAALVLHLTEAESAFVIATVRAGEPCPDAIVSLWKDAGARRLELDRLSDESVAALVEAALEGPVEQGALQWVTERSQGNALYVRELVTGAVEAGTLTLADGLWRLTGRPAVSGPLAELVARRTDGLSDDERAPLELLALGEPLRLNEIAAMTSLDSVIAAEAAGMVVADAPSAGGQVRLAHPLYGEVVRHGLPVLRARELRLRLAEILRRRDPLAPDDALRIARWLLDAGATIPSALLIDAARAATLFGDPDLGARLAELAVDDGAGMPAVLLLARAHTVRKRFADAEAILAGAEDKAAAGDEAIEYLEQRSSVLFWGLDRPRDARDLLARAQRWSDDAGWQRRLDALRVSLVAAIDGPAESVETLAAVLADPATDAETRDMSERRLAVSLFFAGRTGEASALAQGLRPSIPLRGYDDALALGLWRLIGIETGQDLPALEAYMARTLREAVRANDHEAAGQGAFSLGYIRFLAGRYRDAARWFAESDLHFEQQDTFGSLLHVRALHVGVDYFTGDSRRALASLDRLRLTLGGRAPMSSQVAYVARAEGWAARVQGDAAGAERFMQDAERLAEMPVYASQLVYEAMRAGAAADTVAAEQARLAERCDARLVGAYAAHAAALAAGDGSGLMEAAETLAGIGATRYAMEAAADAAAVFVRAGRDESARRAATRARELHVRGQGTEPPEIDGLGSVAVELTRREAQVASLAGQGMTNAEIADQLVLSVRTVETHLYRAMQKRGVSDRREL